KVPRQNVIGKKVREDKRRIAKTLRNQGETYISPVTKKIVKEKALKGICNIEMCKKRKRMCYLLSSPLRTMIFSQLHSLGDLQQQRESMNVSFHKPKKDQCGLCKCYREGSEEVKANLEKDYLAHILEKETVSEVKNSCKEKAKNDTKAICATFDLQQVIYLPISNHCSVFKKHGLLSTI
ncbi:unnamed protein product, partial [Acanthoscelides obtectus]